jgi:ribosomal protein S18 acetylase RimI-like enzyme
VPIEIAAIREEHIVPWRRAVEAVAAERMFLGRVTLPPFDLETAFPRHHIVNEWPMVVAAMADEVVGWADITPSDIPECAHRGTLGMGVVAAHRGKGLGSQMLRTCIDHAARIGLAKVELTVYTSNVQAVSLYRQFGFTQTGLVRDYRRIDGLTQDALMMELIL